MNKKDILYEYKNKQLSVEKISTMIWYICKDYCDSDTEDVYIKANNYDRLKVYLFNLQNQLNDLQEKMRNYADEQFEKIVIEDIEDAKTDLKVRNGIIVKNNVKYIRMGWDYDYVERVIFTDGTVLQNIQRDRKAKIPNDEELKIIDSKNTVRKEKNRNE